MNDQGICPLISMTAELKQLGDYPKCAGEKCAWWSSMQNDCALVALADMLDLHDSSEPLRQISSAIIQAQSALSLYSNSNNSAVAAIEAIGEIGAFVSRHDESLSAIINSLVSIMRDKQSKLDECEARRKQQLEACQEKIDGDTPDN